MFRRPVLVQVIVAALCALLLPARLTAQSKEQGIRLYSEADALREKAQSSADLEQAIKKYQHALAIFQRIGFKQGIGDTVNNLGIVYMESGQYDRAVDCHENALAMFRELKNRKSEGAALTNLGNVFVDLKQYDRAAEYYEQSLAIFRELKDREDEGRTLNNLGNVFKHWEQYEKAVECYEKDLAICRELNDRKGEGQTLGSLGMAYEEWGQYDKAVESLTKSLTISQEFKDRKTEVITLGRLSGVYVDWGQYDKAAEYCKKSLQITRELKNPTAEKVALNNLGTVYSGWGQYDKAVEYYEKALAINRELKDREGEGVILHNLGMVFSDWGQYDKAMEYYDKSLSIDRELKDRRGEGIVLRSLGDVFLNWGQYDKAVEHYEKSLAIRRELKDRRGEGPALGSLGLVFSAWGQYDKAAEYYERTLAICRELKDRKTEASALNNLANIYSETGRYDKAVEYCQKSLAIFRELKDRKGEGSALGHLGSILQDRGDYRSALENFQKALLIWTQINVPTQTPKAAIADINMDMGELARAEPMLKAANNDSAWARFCLLKLDYTNAKEYYGKILRSSEENRNADDLFAAYTGLAAACEGLRDGIGAAEYYEKAVKYTEELRSSLNPSGREFFFDVNVNGFYRTAPYEGLARVQMRQNKPQEAFKTTEYTRARVFSEAMSRMSEGKNLVVPPEIVKQDNSINNELAALKKNLQKAFEKKNKLVIESLEPQVKQLEGKLQAHIKVLREKYPLFAATKYPQPMDISQTDLKDNEWVLAYHVTDPGIIIYLTKGKNLVKGLYKPIPRKEIDELVRKFRIPMELEPDDSVPKKLAAFDFKSGKKLSDLLLADILSDLPKNTPLIIVPDGSLGVVPFEMLVLNEGGKVQTDKKVAYVTGAEFFVDRNPLSYYQSVTALTLARTLGKQQKVGDRTLAMVDPVFSPDDARLVKAAAEKKQAMLDKLTGEKLMSFKSELSLDIPRLPLTTQLGESLKKADPAKTDLYEGVEAQKALLLKNDLKPYRSLVFGTHGYFGKDLPGIQEPVLILTLPDQPKDQDGFLRLSEVMGLKINCDIAALTACQTGLGRHISGEGTMGMGRAFQYAGAKSVLMSLWSVSETSSVQLVESFFRHLKEGKNKPEALRLAREEIRKAGYDHPFYWAPFILVGEVK